MNEYIRSSLLMLNTRYPRYSFEIEEFKDFVILSCTCRVRNKNDMIYTKFIKTRIEKEDLSYEIIEEEGKRLMNEINKSYYGMWPGVIYYDVPKELIFQDEKSTIINWTDGTKTIVKCSDDDVFSPEAGIALCYMKKFVAGNDSERFHRILKGLIRRPSAKYIHSISKFKNSTEENHDIDTGTSDNSDSNNSDNTSMEVES